MTDKASRIQISCREDRTCTHVGTASYTHVHENKAKQHKQRMHQNALDLGDGLAHHVVLQQALTHKHARHDACRTWRDLKRYKFLIHASATINPFQFSTEHSIDIVHVHTSARDRTLRYMKRKHTTQTPDAFQRPRPERGVCTLGRAAASLHQQTCLARRLSNMARFQTVHFSNVCTRYDQAFSTLKLI